MSSSFIPMQDRCENADRKSKDERSSEKGRGYMRSIGIKGVSCSQGLIIKCP